MATTVSMTLPDLPEGWEYTGEYRVVKGGEHYLIPQAGVAMCDGICTNLPHPIIRKKKWNPNDQKFVYSVGGSPLYTAYKLCTSSYTEGFLNSLADGGRIFKTEAAAQVAADKINAIFKENASCL